MRLGLLASSALLFATAAANAGSGPSSIQAHGGPGLWTNAASPAMGREEHTATLLRDGRVLITGGTDGRGKALASAELYDPAQNKWSSAGSMARTRLGHTATLLRSGKVLIAGGFTEPYPAPTMPGSELYDPASNSWSIAAPMMESRTRHTATLLADGRVLVLGGLTVALRDGGLYPGLPADAEVYDPKTDRWSPTTPLGVNRLGQTATLLADGRVLVAGGEDENLSILNSTEIYDPTLDRWISAAPMGVARSGHLATLMAKGDVMVAGGSGREASGAFYSRVPLTSAEIFDPRKNQWVTVAGMLETHEEDTGTLLRNGMVLVVGAPGQSRPEVFDLGRNRWSRTGPSMDRYQHTATRLPDGRVLIVGGYGLDSLDSALIYDPAGVAPAPSQPFDPGVIAALVLMALVLVAGGAWSIPAVRHRLDGWRSRRDSQEWIA
jgi:N-acetylneuraminic acid mutarotase